MKVAVLKNKENSEISATVRWDDRRVVLSDNKTVKLEPKEYSILICALNRYPNNVTVYEICNFYEEKYKKDTYEQTSTGLKTCKSKLQSKIGIKFLKGSADCFEWMLKFVEVSIKEVTESNESLKPENPDLIFAPANKSIYKTPKELSELRSYSFTHDSPTLIISGEHGIGKTTLAKMFAAFCFGDGTIFYTAYNKNLEQTITLLETEGLNKEKPTFSGRIALLEKAVKENDKCLLIIDGYDPNNYKSELVQNNTLYNDLLSTGINILITTTTNMKDARASHQIIMGPLSFDDQVDLFINCALETNDLNKEEIKVLVGILNGNTYLISLASALTAHYPVHKIVSFFRERVQKNPIYTRAITDRDEEKSLYDHYLALFDLSEISENISNIKVLFNLAAMPSSGIRNEVFERFCFPTEEIDDYLTILEKLRKTYYVSLENRRWILHFMIRLIVIKELDFHPDYLRLLISNLIRMVVNVNSIVEDFADILHFSLSLLNLIKEMDAEDKFTKSEIAMLKAGIISMSDIIHLESTISQMYQETCDDLLSKDIEISDENRIDYISSLKNVALAIIRNNLGDKKNRVLLVNSLLSKAKEELCKCNTNEETAIIATKINSIKAGICFQSKEFEQAYQIHEDNYKIRNQLSKSSSEKNPLCAASLRGMGTAKYYLAIKNSENAKILYQESYSLHSQAIEFYKSAGKEYEFEVAKTELRKAGSLFKMHECSPNDSKIIRLIKDEIPYLENSQKIIGSMEMRDKVEEKNCESTLEKAKFLIGQNRIK